MRFQIVSIVLWPRMSERDPRVLPFTTGTVNVISGASKTGKSAIIPVIDYCLGSDRCAIPVDTIRNACCWFGVVVEVDGGQILFARREPGEQKSTGDIFTLEAESIEIPKKTPAKNTSVDAVKARLDELCGLTRLETDPESESGFRGRPSFRDLMAFTFQPQNIVANPDVLFFKADTYGHREKLKSIFPYVLKSVTAETLAALQELDRVTRMLQRRERELQNMQQVSVRWDAELRSLTLRARELGVIASPVLQTTTRDEMLEALTAATTAIDPAPPSLSGLEEAIAELASLQTEEAEIDSS